MFSIMTMASSTTKPVAMVSAMIERLLRLKPARYMTASVPTSDSGTDRLGMRVARQSPRNRKITATTSTTAKTELDLHVVHRGADGERAVGQHRHVERRRQGVAQRAAAAP